MDWAIQQSNGSGPLFSGRDGWISNSNLDCAYISIVTNVCFRYKREVPTVSGKGVILSNDDISNSQISLWFVPLVTLWRLIRNFFFQRLQNSIAKCRTLLHHLLVCRSAYSNIPGEGRTTLVFKVRRWLGVSGSG